MTDHKMSLKKKHKAPTLSRWQKQFPLQESVARHFGNLLITRRLQAIEHLPVRENFISKLFKQCAVMHLMIHHHPDFLGKEMIATISSTYEYPQNINWKAFLDKLITSGQDPNVLISMLYKILVRESISSAKGLKPFWTPAYKELSEQLLSHTGTVYPDLPLISSNISWREQEEKYSSL